MTDIADLQISAFVDDELSADECEFLVRRLTRDAAARGQLLRYETIGAAMRAELLGPDPDILRRRIGAALEGVHLPRQSEPSIAPTTRRYLRPVLGAAIAASVAVVAVLVLRVGPGGEDAVEAEIATSAPSSSPAVSVSSDLPRNFVVPASASGSYSLTMTDYIVQHSQFTPAIRRQSINSSVAGEQHQYRTVPATLTVE